MSNYYTLHVKVTADDIKTGLKKNCHRCPVAIALRRAFYEVFKLNRTVTVNRAYLMIGWRQIDPPKKVKAFISRFDKGNKVSPFEFYATFYDKALASKQ